jgi:anti-anti-sigma factor
MSTPEFEHLRLSRVGDVALVEILSRDLQGPKAGQEFGTELARVLAHDAARRILLDFRRTAFVSSSSLAALFKLVNQARARGRELKFCSMTPAVLSGVAVVGLPKMVEILHDQAEGLKAFTAC